MDVVSVTSPIDSSIAVLKLKSCVPKLSVHTSKATDFEDQTSEVHEGSSEVREMLRLRRIS